jgi:hypothetical protein
MAVKVSGMPSNLVDIYQHSVGIFFFLLLGTEDGAADSFNIGTYGPNYTASHLRRQQP